SIAPTSCSPSSSFISTATASGTSPTRRSSGIPRCSGRCWRCRRWRRPDASHSAADGVAGLREGGALLLGAGTEVHPRRPLGGVGADHEAVGVLALPV